MLRLVLSVLFLSALASSALLGWLFIAPDALKPLARLATERITGYELTLNGELNATFSLQPTIVATDVSLSNATWAQDPELITAELIRVQIDLPGLLERRVELLELYVRGARGALEVREDRASNLDFLIDDDEPSNQPWHFVIQGLVLDNVQIMARIGDIPPISLEIVEVVEVTDPASYLDFTGYGELNDNPWQLTGKVGTLADIIALADVQVDLDLDLDDVLISVDGTIGELTSLHSLNLNYEMRGDDASVWGELLGAPELFQGDTSLTGRIEPADEGLRFSTRGNIAAYQVDAAGTVADAQQLDGIDLAFELAGPEVSVLGLLLLVDDVPSSPFALSGRLTAAGDQFSLSELRIETEFLTAEADVELDAFPELDSGRGSIRFAGGDAAVLGGMLALPELQTLPFDGSATLDAADGQTTFELNFGSNRLLAEGILGRVPDLAGTELTVSATGNDLTDMVRSLGSRQRVRSAYTTRGLLEISPEQLTLSDGRYEIGGVSGSYSGTLALGASYPALALQAEVETDSLQKTGGMLDITGLPDWKLKGTFSVGGSPDGYQLQTAEFSFAEFDLTLSGDLGDLSGLDQMSLSFAFSGPSANVFMPNAIREAEDYPFTIEGRVSSAEELLLFRELRYSAEDTVINGELSLPVGSSLAGLTATFSGQGPSLRKLYPGNEDYRPADAVFRLDGGIHLPRPDLIELQQIDLSVNELHMIIDGALDLSNQIETDLEIAIQSPSMRDIGLINERTPPDLPFELRASLHGEESALEIKSLQLSWSDSDISGSGSIQLEEIPRVKFFGQSNRLDLLTIQEALLDFDDDQGGLPESDLVKIFPDEPISLENLTDFNADVDIVVKEFTTRLLSFDEVSTSVTLEDGTLRVGRFEFRDAVGNFSGTGALEPENGTFNFRARITGEEADLGLFTSPDQPLETVPRYTLDIDLTGRGVSIAEIMGTLDGTLLVHSEGGRINNDLIDTLGGDFLGNVLGTLFPFEEPLPYTQMQCLVFKGRSSDGVLSFKPGFTARTQKVNAFVLGKIDLRNEQLELSFATQARSGIGISASSVLTPYFLIGGTMANPELELDTANAAIAYSLAAGTGGLSILIQGFLDRIRGEQNPCEDYLKLDY